MPTWTINSVASLQSCIGDVRELFDHHKFLKMTIRTGKDRSLDQNAISHCFYEQLARELKEDDALGWKSFSKLTFGVPILRAEDSEFRTFYDAAIKNTLSYEQKLDAMKFMPITSLMAKPQFSQYLEAMQSFFFTKGVSLVFPEDGDE